MRYFSLLSGLMASMLGAWAFAATPPNVLLIVADDLGYAELGAYGSEIATPAIDSLAATGLLHTKFYAHSNCSPSRAMMFSGMDSHLAGLGAMHRFEGPNQRGVAGYEGYLNEQTASLSSLLRDVGYRTYMAGKWHLGETLETLPGAQGFDRYFAQAKGGPPGGHFTLNGAHATAKGIYFEDGTDKTGMPVPEGFFSSNFYTSQLIEYLDEGKGEEAPFFAYLAFSAPHIPVQAPDTHIDLYAGVYDDGYEALRAQRFRSMQNLGLVDEDVVLAKSAPTIEPWDDLSEEEQRVQSRKMEVYAAAIDNLDDNVGRLLQYLRDTGQFDNTLIIFLSDNGAAGFNGWESPRLLERFESADNSLENLGRHGSMMFYGPGWGSAGSTPFYLFKRHMSEGGLRVPFIVSGAGVHHRGAISHRRLTVRDIAPTILELAGADYPKDEYMGRKILPQTGVSLVQHLASTDADVHGDDEVFGWELFKRRAVMLGDWKGLWLEPPFGSGTWQLFDLSVDPGETRDLAREKPERLSQIREAWMEYARENNVVISNAPLRWP